MELNKINANQVGAAQVSEQSKLQKKNVDAQSGAKPKPTASATGDRVQISADASVLSQGLEAIKNSSDVRADRVAELKKSIQAGTYKVDGKKVAEKMLDSSIEEAILSGRRSI